MKKLLFSLTLFVCLIFPKVNFGQAPNIITQPHNKVVCAGTSVSYSVVATGSSLTYQWRKGNTNLVNGGNISGATSAILTINPVSVADASSNINVIVSGSIAPKDTSINVMLDVNTAPVITTQPISQVICEGDTVKLSVVSTGFNLTYQWRKGLSNLISGGNIFDPTSSTLIIYPATPADAATNYNVVVTGGCPPPAVSQNATITIDPATKIVTQPTNQTVCLGSSASFAVSATGTALTYQWMKGNTVLTNGANISGVTTPSLTINPVTALDTASDYNVVISGACGKDTTIHVFLRLIKTNIVTQPGNQAICSGGSANFAVGTSGTIVSYQWMNGSTVLVNGGNISGANTASLTISPATILDTSSFYHVILLGSCAIIDTSINVSLKLNVPPNITVQPSNQLLCAGSAAVFVVTATGSNLTYQWRKGTVNLVNGGNISGATTATLTINPASLSDTSSFYNVIVSGSCPPNDTSIHVYLKFNNPNIFPQPSNLTVCPGDPAVFSVAATGAGLVYQWRRGTVNLVNGGNISGVNTASLVINPTTYADTASNYNVVISGTCPPNDTSINVYLRFNNPVVISQPHNQTLCAGGSASFSVSATGAGLTYQWMNGTATLADGGNISGATTATLTINPATISDSSSLYYVVVSGSCAPTDTSVKVSLKINTAPNITQQPSNQTVCLGNAISFSVSATGTGLTYQWMKGNTVLTNGGHISGVHTPTLTVNPAAVTDTSSFYYVIISGVCSPKDTSIKVSLKITPATHITTQPTSQTVCPNGSASFVVGATGTALTYQWRRGTLNLVDGGDISGSTTASLTINPVTALDTASNYNVIVSGTCGKDSSINVFLRFYKTKITTQPSSVTICAGNSASFSVAATGGSLTYQWFNGTTPLVNGGNISGATAATLTINPAAVSDTSSLYHVVVTGTCGLMDTSINVFLKINTAPNITAQPTNQTVCLGNAISFSVSATGTGLTYQWMKGNTVLTNGGHISGVHTPTLTVNPAAVTDTSSFYYVIISGVCSPKDTSIKVSLKITPATHITTQPTSQTVCPNGSASFVVGATGTALTYQWRRGTVNLVDGGDISGSTTASLTINPVTALDTASNYNVIVSGTCGKDSSINVFLRFYKTKITTQPSSVTICAGNSASFSVAATGGSLTYQWFNGTTPLVNGGNISGATAATLTINPAAVSDTSSLYHVIVTGTCGLMDTSINVFLKINTAPNITTQPSNQTVCLGNAISFSVSATGTGLTYQWMKGNTVLTNGGHISGVHTPTLTVNPVAVTDTSSFYYVIISGVCAPKDTSIKVSLKITPATHIVTQPTNQLVCVGGSASFVVSATGSALTYQWMDGNTVLTNGGDVSGANTATLTINPVTASDTASNYHVIVSGTCGNDTSVNVFLRFYKTKITTQVSNQTVCSGSAASFSVTAIGGTLTYQWFNGTTPLVNGGNISGATAASLTINPATISDASSLYHVIVTGTCGLMDTSINVFLKINTAPNITTQPISQTVCQGSPVSFSVTATGTGITYQWIKGTTVLTNGGNISGATTASLTINPTAMTDTSSFYHVVVTGVCAPSYTSNNVYLKLNTAPNITTQPISQTVCQGSPVSFSVTATGTGLTYQWMNGNTILTNGGNIFGVTTSSLTITSVSAADTSSYYHVVISGVCSPNDTSIKVSLMLNVVPSFSVQPSNQTVCTGSAANFSVTANGTGLTYQWMKGNTTLINSGNISGATTSSLTINPTTISDTSSFYYVVINGTCAPKDTSVKVYLHENALPIVTASTSTTTVCYGSSVVLTAGGALTYTWTAGVIDGVSFIPTSTNTYTVTGTDVNTCTNTANVSVTVNRTIAAPTSNSPVCIGSTINLNTLVQPGATYSWTGPNSFTSAIQSPSIPLATLINGGTYSLSVTNNGCTVDSITNVIINDCNGTDMSVVKTVDNPHPIFGTDIVFTIVAHNNGPKNAIGVIVGDTLQSGYTYVSSSPTKGTYNPSTGIWTIDSLSIGASAILTVTVQVNTSGSYSNTANVISTGIDSVMSNNISSIETFPTDFNIPEGFSPNGDGINDLYIIRGIDNYPHNTFTVFNRWGDKVFGASPYENTWDGKATSGLRVGGDDLPVGTYFYTLDLGDGTKVFRGSIYLNK